MPGPVCSAELSSPPAGIQLAMTINTVYASVTASATFAPISKACRSRSVSKKISIRSLLGLGPLFGVEPVEYTALKSAVPTGDHT